MCSGVTITPVGHCMPIIYRLSCSSECWRFGRLALTSTTSITPSGPLTTMSGWNAMCSLTINCTNFLQELLAALGLRKRYSGLLRRRESIVHRYAILFTRNEMKHSICTAVAMFGFVVSIRAQPSPNTSLFSQQIRPILEQQCQTCHGGAAKQSGLDITTREKLLRGGDHGPALVPGKPEESLLYLYLKGERKPSMPFGGKQLSEEQIARFAEWIRAGAPFEEPLKAATAPRPTATDHW